MKRRDFMKAGAVGLLSPARSPALPKGCTKACLERYPGRDWQRMSPADAGFNERALKPLLPMVGVGGMIIRHGYVIASWGDPGAPVNTASLGKSFTSTCLGLAADAGMIKLDDPVWKSWTGEGQLSHKYKHLNVGHHRRITWRHFATMTSGFPDIDLASPDGEMGDITSNYAKRPPGEDFEYSDGAMWRFSQALTKLWGRDLKGLIDEKIFSQIGVPARSWDWLPGKLAFENLLYPFWPGYGRYLDPPWEIDGHVVRAGPGWVIVNASDVARFGYLYLRNGQWKGRQLLSEAWIRQIPVPGSRAHGGSGGSDYNLNWWLPGRGVYEMRGSNINWQAVSRLAVVPEYDLVVASVRTAYLTRQPQESAYFAGYEDHDWLFRVLETIEN